MRTNPRVSSLPRDCDVFVIISLRAQARCRLEGTSRKKVFEIVVAASRFDPTPRILLVWRFLSARATERPMGSVRKQKSEAIRRLGSRSLYKPIGTKARGKGKSRRDKQVLRANERTSAAKADRRLVVEESTFQRSG